MRPDIRRLAAAAAFVSLFGLTGCTREPEKPGLDEAAKLLLADGEKLLASQDMSAVGSASITERADQDEEAGCLKGQVQRFFRAHGDLTGPPYKQSPGNVAGLLASWLRMRSYSPIVDDLDFRDDNLGTTVVQHPTTGITFAIAIRNGQKPHILIVGKTSCYERGA
ncbi:hypothetical protein ACIBEJ_30205 [Nonomuraea sp. NPDC050790]|uniref:hypothetical protein n=1 Tax=Nonomuraea sp. NPDC050790 TaxID=3364371 RepID=UPI0037BC3896